MAPEPDEDDGKTWVLFNAMNGKRALYHNAAAVVLAHNHPSGEVTPSKADRLITERLVQALGLVDIRTLFAQPVSATFWLYERVHCCKSTHLSGNWLKSQQ